MQKISSDIPQEIKNEDKFFSKLLSRENSVVNSSSRVYYGGASVAVPFMWESQPGTPKKQSSDTSLPPLTPPPSYHFNSKKKPPKNNSRSKSSNLLQTLFPKRNMKKTHNTSSPSSSLSSLSSSSSSSSSLSSSNSPITPNFRRKNPYSSPRSLYDSRGDEDPGIGSPTSTLYFEVGRENKGWFRGCYYMVIMKNALLSIVSHGSS